MVRILVERAYNGEKKYIEGACVAADVAGLPTDGIVTGSKMTCADTGDVYMFAEGDSPAWSVVCTPTEEQYPAAEGVSF